MGGRRFCHEVPGVEGDPKPDVPKTAWFSGGVGLLTSSPRWRDASGTARSPCREEAALKMSGFWGGLRWEKKMG